MNFFFFKCNQLKIKIHLSLNSMGCLKLDYYEDLQVRTCVPMLSHEAKVVLCWLSVDPLAEKYPSHSPYSFVFNNPMRFTDPTGMAPDDIIIKGALAQKALAELQKSVGNGITLALDNSGKVSYTSNSQGTLTNNATEVSKIINDHSITVNVTASESVTTSTGYQMIGGSFMGNTVTTSPTGNTVEANQEINPRVLGVFADANNKPGEGVLHEVTEGYQGALLSQKSGVSSPVDGQPNSVYTDAHKNATPQPGPINARYFNSAGMVIMGAQLPGVTQPAGTVKAQYYSNGQYLQENK
jgi:hypothetical protein